MSPPDDRGEYTRKQLSIQWKHVSVALENSFPLYGNMFQDAPVLPCRLLPPRGGAGFGVAGEGGGG